MWIELLIRYVHFIGFILLASGLVVEQFLIAKEVPAKHMRKLATADTMCGLGIVLILVTGTLLWFAVGKSAEFYSGNWVFHLKLTAVFSIVLLAVYPALYFSKNRNNEIAVIVISQRIINCVRLEMALLLLVPLLAVFMARGY